MIMCMFVANNNNKKIFYLEISVKYSLLSPKDNIMFKACGNLGQGTLMLYKDHWHENVM